jgi:hypothetical protein
MKSLSPLKAIRLNCLECSCGSTKEVAACIMNNCPLRPYRFGYNPKRKGVGTIRNLHRRKGHVAAEPMRSKRSGDVPTPAIWLNASPGPIGQAKMSPQPSGHTGCKDVHDDSEPLVQASTLTTAGDRPE